ncbi:MULTISPECIES: NupC/NupG family nucleoside CNT transporter [Caloramator]|uniref:Nucleoside permease n=1 Tax=Caloramator australicus RC3 TaxID=857293 RepID=I7LH27_9CLOT|nr:MULTISPECIES: NupC/NupG family nucleoside CNT transporter [Caloramator]MDO6353506.1 NupC/NupG family nucleoside CNT transporter [Caloramator sp. CAR-1]CCJ33720.1 Nucleoside permease NupC [Caloramator australicus RC3]
MEKLISLLGIAVILGIAFLLSENKKKVNWVLVAKGITIQFIFALIVLKWSVGQRIFNIISRGVTKLLDFTKFGTTFLFGDLIDSNKFGVIFALQILPTIIFFSALMSILYYLGIMQAVVSFLAKIMLKILGTSGAESLSNTANIFLGQTEAPLLIKPYVNDMTRSELLTIMVGGMATVAGGVMAGYIAMGIDAGHLIAASLMAAPASLMISKIMLPETEEPKTKGKVNIEFEKVDANVIDAAARGASEGLQLSLNVGAMLIAFIALIYLINYLIAKVGYLVGIRDFSLEWILGRLFAPVTFIIGVPLKDVINAGSLLGQKIVINEFFAFANLSNLIKGGILQQRTITLLTYALCGFANISSIAIQIGGIGGLAPDRRSDIAKLGIKALIGGTLVGLLNAAIAGLLL